MNEEGSVSDTQLLQYLHEELTDDERARVDAHLAASPAAAERLLALRRRSVRLSAMLSAADPSPAEVRASARAIMQHVPVGARRITPAIQWWPRTPALRMAAAVTLVLGGALLVEPARAWMIDGLRAAAVAVGLTSDERAPAVAPAPAGSTMRVSFAWTGSTFEIAAGAASGTLVLRRGETGRAAAESNGTGGIVITPRGIRLDAAGADGAVYTVTLPPSVGTVRLIRPEGASEHALPATGEVNIPLT